MSRRDNSLHSAATVLQHRLALLHASLLKGQFSVVPHKDGALRLAGAYASFYGTSMLRSITGVPARVGPGCVSDQALEVDVLLSHFSDLKQARFVDSIFLGTE